MEEQFSILKILYDNGYYSIDGKNVFNSHNLTINQDFNEYICCYVKGYNV